MGATAPRAVSDARLDGVAESAPRVPRGAPGWRMAAAVRALVIDAVTRARSGHTALPLGMADVATVLWTRFLKFDAADPRWQDRDRFVLSAGHGSMLLYALLHLTGYEGMGIEDLRRFRRLGSPAAGHPEYGDHPAIELTTGPLGQGIAAAVGMALTERMLAARFGKSLVDHRTWVIASDGDLMEGISHEAASLAGHLRLEKLALLHHENGTSFDGDTRLACSDDVRQRFTGYGWAVKQIDAQDPAQIAAALSFALRARKPTLITCRTPAGEGAFAEAAATGAIPSPTEADAAKRALGWNLLPFEVPAPLQQQWRAVGSRGASARRAWLKRLARHPLRPEFERALAGRLSDTWYEPLSALKAQLTATRRRCATRQASLQALEAVAPALPELTGGSADLSASTLAQPACMGRIAPGSYAGRYIHYGVREHAMAAAMNGMAVHGGVIPYASTFLAFSDYLRPALRLAAIMRQRVIHVLTHDSIGVGEDGPTHQPVEHLASLRAMPNVHVFRPADAVETVEAWELAIRHTEGPSVLALSRQELPALRRSAQENCCARGGYVLAAADGARRATLIASGSEVSIALEARASLSRSGLPVAVVSLPCWELFALQDEGYRQEVLGTAPRFGIEAACGLGWERWLGEGGVFIGVQDYGASAPGDELYRHFGITADNIVAAVRKRLG